MGHLHHHQHGHALHHYNHSPPPPPAYYPPVPYSASLAAQTQPRYPGPEPWGPAPPVHHAYDRPNAGLHQAHHNPALPNVHRHARNERIGELGTAAAGAFAAYEMHQAKVDPAHASRHKLEASLAGATALGSAGYAYHERREKKKSELMVGEPVKGSFNGIEQHQKRHHMAVGKKQHHHHLLH